jgi:hypothetical protein
MAKKFLKKMLVLTTIFLFVSAGFTSVNSETKNKEILKNQLFGPSGNVQLGDPQQDGNFTLFVTFTAKMPGTGARYTANVVVKAKINGSDNATAKANKVREAINKSAAPLTGEGGSSSVEIRPGKNCLGVNITRIKDETRQNQSSNTSYAGYSFEGQPPFSNYPLKLWVDGVYDISVNPEGKTLPLINSEFVLGLLAAGFNALLDPTGLAFYIFDIQSSGIQSENDEITPYAVFQPDETEEPFNVLVGFSEPRAAEPGETIVAHFDIVNFRFVPDLYEITVTDILGWDLDPVYLPLPMGPWQIIPFDLEITIPIYKIPVYNIINVTAKSVAEPWYTGTSSLEVRVSNNPPSTPSIDGSKRGKINALYEYKFLSTDPDNDDLYYVIDWGDNTPEVSIGPYASGSEVSDNHSWSVKGTYVLQVKSKDTYGAESDWATLEISIPRSRVSVNLLTRILFERFSKIFQILGFLLN